MNAAAMSESVSDYTGFDFAALWPGREKVTEVERAIVSGALRDGDCRRILEVGTGFGRLLGALTELSDEVVATDFDLPGLMRLPGIGSTSNPMRVAANVYHLPFADGAFTSATMVRVYHHLSQPERALQEVARVLRGGGRLVISYNPKPSLGTFVNDVQRAIHPSARARFRSITFTAGPTVLDPDPFPIFVSDRPAFERTVSASGFRPGVEVVSGLEEYYLMRHVPARWFVRIGTAFGRAPAFPARFATLSRPGSDSSSLPPLRELFSCPRCGSPRPEWGLSGPLECDRCPFSGKRHNGVLDLRYVPEGATRWEPGK